VMMSGRWTPRAARSSRAVARAPGPKTSLGTWWRVSIGAVN